MKHMTKLPSPYRLAGFVLTFGVLFTSACEVSLKDPNAESERENVQFETWNSAQGSSGYSFVKCSTSGPHSLAVMNICGVKDGESTAQTNYNWHTNCSGSDCGMVSVIADYMLMENLGPQQTMHIEAFDNPKFNHSPVASLEISGFDATRPGSSGREELFLAPGEYYFRAYLTHDEAPALPYSLDGMELVSDLPVGVLGALSGAKRVVVKPGRDETETVHIYIDQLFKKNQPAEDTLAKFRLQIAVNDKSAVQQYRDVHILLLQEANLEINPSYDFKLSSNALVNGSESTDFVSPSLAVGSYYVFTYVDANSNGFVDSGELGSFVETNGNPTLVAIDKNRTKQLLTTLAVMP